MNKQLSSIRSEIKAVNDKLSELEPLYTTRDNALARVDAYIEGAESALELDLSGFALFKKSTVRVFAYGEMHSLDLKAPGTDVAPIFATFMKDQFRKWLVQKIDDQVGDNWGDTVSNIKAQENDLLTQLFELECKEEALVSEMQAAGEEVVRRENIKYPLTVALENPERFAESIL